VAEDHRAPGADVVDVAVAVSVDQEGTLGADDHGRVAAHGAEGANGGIDPAGQELLCALLELARTDVGAGWGGHRV